jgi:hypothetical protein
MPVIDAFKSESLFFSPSFFLFFPLFFPLKNPVNYTHQRPGLPPEPILTIKRLYVFFLLFFSKSSLSSLCDRRKPLQTHPGLIRHGKHAQSSPAASSSSSSSANPSNVLPTTTTTTTNTDSIGSSQSQSQSHSQSSRHSKNVTQQSQQQSTQQQQQQQQQQVYGGVQTKGTAAARM